jgi:hypothetical protein
VVLPPLTPPDLSDLNDLDLSDDERSALDAAPDPLPPPPFVHARQIWQAALGTLQQQLTPREFDAWFRGLELLTLDDTTAILRATTTLQRDGLIRSYLMPLKRAISDVVGRLVSVHVVGGA